jgi:NADH-quinone oxidoreductase subunit E
MTTSLTSNTFFSESTMRRFDREIKKYPSERKQSAVIACLTIVQEERGWVSPESEKALAKYLEIPPIAVHEVTTFYNMYNTKPVGKFKINVCTNLSCTLRGGGDTIEYLCKKLGIKQGETSKDNLFTVQQSECLGACGDAPVLLVNDKSMCSFMDQERIDTLLNGLRKEGGV